MSNEAQGLVRNLPMEAPHKPILMAYANYADESGYCFPGVETIAFDTGYSAPTVVRVRRDLIKQNWLRSKRRFGTSAGTRLNLVKIATKGVDRGDRTKLKPEFEFEDETPGQPQRDQPDLNDDDTGSRSDHSDLNSQITLISTTDHSDHLSISPLSVDPSVEGLGQNEGGKEEPTSEEAPPAWAMRLIADLEYGRHRRPNRKQAVELALLVNAAHSAHGLPERLILRHCRTALNGATKSGVGYLRGALHPDNLPVPPSDQRPAVPLSNVGEDRGQGSTAERRGHQSQPADGHGTPVADVLPRRGEVAPVDLSARGMPAKYLPKRLRQDTSEATP